MGRFNSLPCSLNTIAKRYSSDMAQNYVKRVTLFKVPKSEHIDQVLQAYEVLKKDAKRVHLRLISSLFEQVG
jgi:thymidylate synthase